MLHLSYEYDSPLGLRTSSAVSNSSLLLIQAATELGIAWEIVVDTSVIEFTYLGKTQTYYFQVPSSTSALASYACRNKRVVNTLLQRVNITIPNGYKILRRHKEKYQLSVFRDLKKPLVVKPSNGTWGENVTVGITDEERYLEALELAFAYSSEKASSAIVEEMFYGDEYRILLTPQKIIGIVQRVPANVVGNAIDSIHTLIKKKNAQPNRGTKGSDKSHLKIRVDKRLRQYLSEQGLHLDYVPPKGTQIFLRKVSNISQGGDAIDVTDLAHDSVKQIAIKAIRAVPGLTFAGIDFMTKDITKEQTADSYVIIEINDSPGFDIHDMPYIGKNRHATFEFLCLLFPELEERRSEYLALCA